MSNDAKKRLIKGSTNDRARFIAQNFFIYSAIFENGIPAGGSDSRTIVIQNNSDFEVIKLSSAILYNLNGPDNTTTLSIPGATVMITENASNEPWMSNPVPVYSLFGSGQLPFVMPYTKILKRKRQLVVTVYNQFTATDMAYVELSFIGRRLYSPDGKQ